MPSQCHVKHPTIPRSVSNQLFLPKSVGPDVWSIYTITHAKCKHLALQSFWIVETGFVLSPTVDGVENGFNVLIFKFTAVSPICAKWWDWVHHFNFQIPEQCLNLWLKVGQETCSQKVVSVPTAAKKSLAAKSGETKTHILYKNSHFKLYVLPSIPISNIAHIFNQNWHQTNVHIF